MKYTISLLALIAAAPAFAEDTRELDTHEHGVGTLNIAIDGTTVAMEFEAPGADIVGFEYTPESEEDLNAIELALAKLAAPLDLFVISDAAACALVNADANLESEADHDEHEAHANEGHNEHDDDEHSEDAHDDHAEEANHAEFYAVYTFTCEQPNALTRINFAYFDAFANAQEVEVQIITSSGARAFEVKRDSPVLNLDQ